MNAAVRLLTLAIATMGVTSTLFAEDKFPPHADVLKDYDKVVSTLDDEKSLWTVYKEKGGDQVLLELPSSFTSHKYFIALTIASGDTYAGLQSGEMYVYMRRYGKYLAMITPNVDIRSTGDSESKASVQRLFTDRMLLRIPIVTMGPGGGPVIDGDYLCVNQAPEFFGRSVVNPKFAGLFKLKKSKAFPQNVELGFEVPNASGRLNTLYYSISLIKGSASYKPRAADTRIGYFTTSYSDFGKFDEDDVTTRYINRWHLEKADSNLNLSPPKNPIVFYIEHTTPVRYRRWVREGVLYWNKAFENIGISNAIEVEYQDAASGRHMEKDPEDVRYNFVRWLNNGQGTAIGPSRVNPLTGEILDADIILTDGWIRHYKSQFSELLPKIAMENFDPHTVAWLAQNPRWDPRVRFAPQHLREIVAADIAQKSRSASSLIPTAENQTPLLGDDAFDGLLNRTSQVNGYCTAGEFMALDMELMRLHLAALEGGQPTDDAKEEKEDEDKKEDKDEKKKDEQAKDEKKDDAKDDDEKKEDKEKKEEKKDDEPKIDGMPEAFVGPLLAHLVAHEVGHTLGLRHNFKGSSIADLNKVNSKDSKEIITTSVMDYCPTNIRYKLGETQGPYTLIGIGPYDMWAIEYGYTFEKDLKKVLSRVAEPELQFATDEDTYGPDPFARRYDFGKDPLKYAEDQIGLANFHRERLLESFVKEGESWAKAREGYELTLSLQLRVVSMMANWLGGVHIYRDKKGDPNGREPIEIVSAAKQREALEFVINSTFKDEAYGLTPELLRHMTSDKWLGNASGGYHSGSAFDDADYPIHERIGAIQASTMSLLLNPTTVSRMYDNEFVVDGDEDAFTVAELITTVGDSVWSELKADIKDEYTNRAPAISSLRRNLQREHLFRMITLATSTGGFEAAQKTVAALAIQELRDILAETKSFQEKTDGKLDDYTKSHLNDTTEAIERVLESQLIYNAGQPQ